MRSLTGGVTVIGAYGRGGVPMALTATAVTSLSAEPPSLLVCVNRSARWPRRWQLRGALLGQCAGHRPDRWAKAFGGQLEVRGTGRFIYGNWRRVDDTEVPVLTGSRVSFECEVSYFAHEWATHHIVIGSVLDVHFSRGSVQSLCYRDGQYHAAG